MSQRKTKKSIKLTLPYPPSIKRSIKGISNEILVSLYHKTGNVWVVGQQLNIHGQSVWRRLKKIGIVSSLRTFTNAEKDLLRKEYLKYCGLGKLEKLAKSMGRTKYFICRQAKKLGLTKQPESKVRTQRQRKDISKAMKKYIAEKGHPRGMFGKKHTEETKAKIGVSSKRAWALMTNTKKTAKVKKMLKTKIAKGYCHTPQKTNCTWKAGWRTIAGSSIYFRSRWEYNYAVYLDFLVSQKQITSWKHEPKTFWFDKIKRGCRTYLPDFRIINLDGSEEYHEVKGWMDARSKTKLRRMRKYYPETKLRIIDSDWFKRNGKLLSGLPGWEI